MIWAKVGNDRIEAKPGTTGTCPLCEGKVFSKCGELYVWHWAHSKDENCDHWSEPETPWHLHWKMTFGKENTEVAIIKNEKKHRADIQTPDKVIIELQNSPIAKPIIREREDFYGERMLWIINGKEFKDNFNTSVGDGNPFYEMERQWDVEAGLRKANDIEFKWKYARRSWSEVHRNVFIDFGDLDLFWVLEGMGASKGIGVYVSKESFIEKYRGNYEYYCQHNPNNIKSPV